MISIIVPAYNEEKRISAMIDSYIKYMRGRLDFEMIVICDGRDGTAKVVKEKMHTCGEIKLIEFGSRLGKGGGIIEGFKAAQGNVVGFIDADESVKPEYFDRLLCSINLWDCAIASRRVPGAVVLKDRGLVREIASYGFNVLCNTLFDFGIYDTQCGSKVFKKEVIDSVLPDLKLTGFEFDVDLLWNIKKKGFSIMEVPITWSHSDGSTFSLRYAPIIFINLLKLRFQ